MSNNKLRSATEKMPSLFFLKRGKIPASKPKMLFLMLQESKFLGGDMEHTHLVKGLDFALLQKVRSEIATRETEEEPEEEAEPKEVKP
jgi:hypothetical protein